MSEPQRKRLLIVEDEAIAATDLEMTLRGLGYLVAGVCASGAEAIAAAAANPPDLVLMDLRLQGEMDGVEAAREMDRRWGVPTLFLTAYADSETVRRASLPFTYGYLVKPYDERELAPAIEIALLRHGLDRSARGVVRKLEETFSALEVGVAFLAADGRFEFLTDTASRQLGVERGEAIGRTLEELCEVEREPEAGGATAAESTGTLRPRAPVGGALRFEKVRLGDGFLLRCRRERADLDAELAVLGRGISRGLESAAARVAQELRPRLEELRGTARVLGLPEGVGPNRAELQRRLVDAIDSMGVILRRLELGDELAERLGQLSTVDEPVGLALAECSGLAARRGVEVRLDLPPGLPAVRADTDLLGEALAALLEDVLDLARRGDAVQVRARTVEGAEGPRVQILFERLANSPGAAGAARAGGPRAQHWSGGFGFDFARRAIERHGGRLSALDEDGRRETLVAELVPVARAGEPPTP